MEGGWGQQVQPFSVVFQVVSEKKLTAENIFLTCILQSYATVITLSPCFCAALVLKSLPLPLEETGFTGDPGCGGGGSG